MKKLFVYCMLLFFVLPGQVISAQENEEIKVPLTQPGKKGKLVVSSMMGPVKIIAANRQDVLVKYSAKDLINKKDDDDDDDQDEAEQEAAGMRKISSGGLKFDVTERNNEVVIKNAGIFKYAALTVEVPTTFDLKIRTMTDGGIEIQGVQGELDIESLNGDLNLMNVGGTVLANALNGNIKASLSQITHNAPMAFTTFNGKVDVTFPASLKANFKLRSLNGEVFTDFDFAPLETKGASEANRDQDGLFKISVNKWVYGAVNGGGVELKVETYNGNIYIRKK